MLIWNFNFICQVDWWWKWFGVWKFVSSLPDTMVREDSLLVVSLLGICLPLSLVASSWNTSMSASDYCFCYDNYHVRSGDVFHCTCYCGCCDIVCGICYVTRIWSGCFVCGCIVQQTRFHYLRLFFIRSWGVECVVRIIFLTFLIEFWSFMSFFLALGSVTRMRFIRLNEINDSLHSCCELIFISRLRLSVENPVMSFICCPKNCAQSVVDLVFVMK